MPLQGTSVRRVEDARLLKGEATYVGDLDLPGALHVGFVTSNSAHALLARVDVTEARAVPGVVDVVTAADIELGALPIFSPAFNQAMVRHILATDRVRFVGEAIVAIVAESAEAVADAADLVEIDYEPLPPVVRVEDALRDEVLLFPEAGTNRVIGDQGGSTEPLPFDDCEVVVDAVFRNQRLAPCPIETRVAAATWVDGRLVQYASCQGPHPVRDILARLYGLEKEQVRVITSDVGGSFGAKARPYPEDMLLPLLAQCNGRPVRWVPTRSDDMVGLGHSRAQRQEVRIGGQRDGTITCLQVHVVADAGAYPLMAPNMANNTGVLLPGPYDIPHVSWTNECVVTNTTPLVAYRGAGRPEAGALVDRAVDLFAAEIGMDPAEIRRRNLLRDEDFPWLSPTGLTYDSGTYHRAFAMALENADYESVRAEQKKRREAGDTKLLGVGLSVFVDRTAGIPGSEYGAVELRADGTVLVKTGSSPYGQGHYTSWAMLVADRTGIPLDRIEVTHGDTDVIPRGGITGGSRSVQKAGSAVAEATDQMVSEGRLRAADMLEAAAGDVVLDADSGRFHVAGAPGAAVISWAELAASVASDPLKCESDFDGEGPTFPFGAYVVVVEVDAETGMMAVQRVVTVDDAGTILNPMLALGQVHGGLAQGLAQGMYEEFVYDDDGNPLTSTFADYGIPSAADLPSFECVLTETPSPNNPLGFKGIAESGTIGAPPALQNAAIDALAHLGVRHMDLPVTPERVWQVLNGHAPAS